MVPEPFISDRFGFPMLWVNCIGAYLQVLPVTKVQLEYFLCDARDGHFERRWYDSVLQLNPRTTARRIWRDNYWQGFATGLLPSEAERVAAWCGSGYRLPTKTEWMAAFVELRAYPDLNLLSTATKYAKDDRARELLGRLDLALRDAASTSGLRLGGEVLSAMKLGAMEWVRLEFGEPGRWGALGEPNPRFFGNLLVPERGDLLTRPEIDSERHHAFGFRMVYDPRVAASADLHNDEKGEPS